MKKQIKYVQVSADNAENCKVYESLMYEYALPIFTDIHELAAFELNFKNNWLQRTCF